MLTFGYGITNLVPRTTAVADELSSEELLAGRKRLESKVRRYRPRLLAVLGIGAYRTAFQERNATLGLQPKKISGTTVWVLPNPSGLNAHYQLADLADHFRLLRETV